MAPLFWLALSGGGGGACLFLVCVFACVRVLCSLARLNAFILPVLCWLDKFFGFRPFARSCPLLRLQVLASDKIGVLRSSSLSFSLFSLLPFSLLLSFFFYSLISFNSLIISIPCYFNLLLYIYIYFLVILNYLVILNNNGFKSLKNNKNK